jgi:hypothetical protein
VTSSSTQQCERDIGGSTPWSLAWVSSSLSHGAPYVTWFDPTRFRRQGEPIWKTYSEGNGRRRVGDGNAVRLALGNGEGGL